MRAGADVIYQAAFVTAAGAASPTSSSARRTAATRWSTRSSRATRSPRTCCSSASTPSRSARIPGVDAGTDAHRARLARAREPARAGLPRLLPPGARPVHGRGRRGDQRLSAAGLVLRAVRLPEALRGALARRRPPDARRAAAAATRPGGSKPSGSRPSRRWRTPPTRRGRRRWRRARSRRCATRRRCRSRRAPRATRGRCCRRSRPAGSSCCRRRADGDLFFDIEGDPFWEAGKGLEYLWGIVDTAGAFRRSGRTTGCRSGGRSRT